MAEIKKTRLTQAGFDKLVAELEDLKVNKRKEIADKIKEARAQGDLSENAEYDAAKDEQSEMEGRIEEIEQIMKNHEIVTNVGDGRIGIGCKVLVKDIEMDETMELVGPGQRRMVMLCFFAMARTSSLGTRSRAAMRAGIL